MMSAGAQELKPPSPGAGAPQGPHEDGPALGEEGEDGSWGDRAVGWWGRPGGWAWDGGAHAIQLILLPDRPDLHLSELEGVLPAGPGGPLDPIGVGAVVALEVLPVEVGGVAVAVPPGTMVESRAVILRVVVVQVLGGELHPVVLQEGVACPRGKEP